MAQPRAAEILDRHRQYWDDPADRRGPDVPTDLRRARPRDAAPYPLRVPPMRPAFPLLAGHRRLLHGPRNTASRAMVGRRRNGNEDRPGDRAATGSPAR